MTGLAKPQRFAKFEIASFSRCKNITGEPQPRAKPQLLVKFEVAGFICYRNIREVFTKNWDKQKWRTLYFWKKMTLPLDSQT